MHLEQASSSTHWSELDGMRGLAILPVLLLHFTKDIGFTPHATVDHVYLFVASLGWWGVDLFFVLSGFLITGILLDAKGSTHALRNFYIRRTLRIFPVYYAYLAAMLIILPSFEWWRTHAPPAGEGGLWLWLYLTNIRQAFSNSFEVVPPFTGHFWSLAVEEQFYLIWPWLVYAIDCRRLRRICLVLIIASPMPRAALGFTGWWVTGYTLMPTRMDSLLMGALVAIQLRKGDDIRRHLMTGRYAAAAAFLVFVATTFAPDMHGAAQPVLRPALRADSRT